MNEFRRPRRLQFRPELANENVHCVVFDVTLVAPDGFDKPVPRKYSTGIPQQQFKKFEFSGRESNRNARPLYLMFCRI